MCSFDELWPKPPLASNKSKNYQDSFVEQCEKHDNNDEMISDAAVSEEVQGRINAINEAAKAEHRVLTKKEKRKICSLYLQLLQQDLQLE